MMYIEFSMELAEPGGLVISDVGPTENQQEIIKLIEQWERAGKDTKALELIGKTENEMLDYLRETVAPEKTQYLNALRESTHNVDFSSAVSAKARANSLQNSISSALRDSGISIKGEDPRVNLLSVMKVPHVNGRYFIEHNTIHIDRDLWGRLGEYLERGREFSAEELRQAKEAVKTLLHEYIHSLNDLSSLKKAQVAHSVEEALTEYIAHEKINIFIRQLGLDTINKDILNIEIKRTYTAQTGSLDRLLQYVSQSQKGRTKMAIEMHRIVDKYERADYYINALEHAKKISFTKVQRDEFRTWFGNWYGSDYINHVESAMRVVLGIL